MRRWKASCPGAWRFELAPRHHASRSSQGRARPLKGQRTNGPLWRCRSAQQMAGEPAGGAEPVGSKGSLVAPQGGSAVLEVVVVGLVVVVDVALWVVARVSELLVPAPDAAPPPAPHPAARAPVSTSPTKAVATRRWAPRAFLRPVGPRLPAPIPRRGALRSEALCVPASRSIRISRRSYGVILIGLAVEKAISERVADNGVERLVPGPPPLISISLMSVNRGRL
jgi:hypothetical protein